MLPWQQGSGMLLWVISEGRDKRPIWLFRFTKRVTSCTFILLYLFYILVLLDESKVDLLKKSMEQADEPAIFTTSHNNKHKSLSKLADKGSTWNDFCFFFFFFIYILLKVLFHNTFTQGYWNLNSDSLKNTSCLSFESVQTVYIFFWVQTTKELLELISFTAGLLTYHHSDRRRSN